MSARSLLARRDALATFTAAGIAPAAKSAATLHPLPARLFQSDYMAQNVGSPTHSHLLVAVLQSFGKPHGMMFDASGQQASPRLPHGTHRPLVGSELSHATGVPLSRQGVPVVQHRSDRVPQGTQFRLSAQTSRLPQVSQSGPQAPAAAQVFEHFPPLQVNGLQLVVPPPPQLPLPSQA
jgi:hypothetical protein